VEIKPFKIQVSDSALKDLRERLARTRWPDAIPGTGWEYGANLDYMKELVEYWLTKFDWQKQESTLNRFHHFRAKVDGFGIHFIHEMGKGPNPLPLVITHGWPGSFAEMVKIIPLLTDPAAHGGDPADAFDVVVPSMPGYGFSDRPTQRGMNVFRFAELWVKLMTGLGYPRFGAQGGDFGAGVSTALGLYHPEHVIGLHLNYIPGSYRPFLEKGPDELSEAEKQFLADDEKWYAEEGGYCHVQLTHPQSVSFGLNDSPAGLAAWIVEKFRAWGDCDGNVERRFSKDELLTNVMIYWVTETIASSIGFILRRGGVPCIFKKGSASRFRAASRTFPKKRHFHRANGLNAATTFSTGATCPPAATSRRWRSRSCWWKTSGHFSVRYEMSNGFPMNFESIRQYCLSFPYATEDIQWKTSLLFRVGGKIFVSLSLDRNANEKLSFKCHPEIYFDLIKCDGIKPAPYVARYHWVALERFDALSEPELKSLIEDSYELVFTKLPKKAKSQLEERK